MILAELKKERLHELKNYGWQYDMMEGGYISPDFSCIAIDNRFPYNNQLLNFSNKQENYQNTISWLNKNGFIKEEK